LDPNLRRAHKDDWAELLKIHEEEAEKERQAQSRKDELRTRQRLVGRMPPRLRASDRSPNQQSTGSVENQSMLEISGEDHVRLPPPMDPYYRETKFWIKCGEESMEAIEEEIMNSPDFKLQPGSRMYRKLAAEGVDGEFDPRDEIVLQALAWDFYNQAQSPGGVRFFRQGSILWRGQTTDEVMDEASCLAEEDQENNPVLVNLSNSRNRSDLEPWIAPGDTLQLRYRQYARTMRQFAELKLPTGRDYYRGTPVWTRLSLERMELVEKELQGKRLRGSEDQPELPIMDSLKTNPDKEGVLKDVAVMRAILIESYKIKEAHGNVLPAFEDGHI
jgi:hypothetical protein